MYAGSIPTPAFLLRATRFAEPAHQTRSRKPCVAPQARSRAASHSLAAAIPCTHHAYVHYVYLLQSARIAPRRYIGTTSDLKRRPADHNSGKSVHTAQYRPWHLVTYVAFSEKRKAHKFERCLKSGYGHAFANRHLW